MKNLETPKATSGSQASACNYLRLFAVNYLLWPQDRPGPWPAGYREVARGPGQILLHNPENAYVRPVRHVRLAEDWTEFVARVRDSQFNVYESTTLMRGEVEAKSHRKYQKGAGIPINDFRLSARVFPLGPGETLLRCTTLREGQIMISEPAAPGWRVYVNDERLPNQPFPADGMFINVPVPAGRSEILLRYDPASQRLGLFITLLCLALVKYRLARTGRRMKIIEK